jgi:adenine C2-methylase RlmN of 23S rRNA A2503 and tRNA A37
MAYIIRNHMVIITSGVAERISDYILSTNNKILAISIMDSRGNIIAANSKESFKEAFRVTRDGDKYGGSLAVAALAVANEVRDVAGEAEALITIYKKCNMMLLPLTSFQLLIGLVLERSANVEDYYIIANNVERFLMDTAKADNSNNNL